MPVNTVNTYSCRVYKRFILLPVRYLSWCLQVQYICVARSIYVCQKVQDHCRLIDVRKRERGRILLTEDCGT
jgi:hypothetical protein